MNILLNDFPTKYVPGHNSHLMFNPYPQTGFELITFGLAMLVFFLKVLLYLLKALGACMQGFIARLFDSRKQKDTFAEGIQIND